MSFRKFFEQVEPIIMIEPLAGILGAFTSAPGSPVSGREDAGEAVRADLPEVSYSFTDLVKLAGHACPTMAGSYLACQAALRALYPNRLPVRGEIGVTLYGDADEGTYGVMGQAFSLLTGAAPATGFKGLGPKFRRKDLLQYSREKPDPQAQCFEFRRMDTGAAVLVRFSPRAIPFPQEKTRRMGELMEKVVWDAARPEEQAEFQDLWMEKVHAMLVERRGIESWLSVEERSA